ncbi:hypothetical protein ARMGADRAFT_50902 [Armillaria gallica]|uniref:Uncharacterized protein n=1 Tax=Armillaria gallica TaxID=47427 RepID=A0A2H3EAA6_ARMGA|nr:hypothetical protein ARMGADRAFT_50902 [Armillaria gallica]
MACPTDAFAPTRFFRRLRATRELGNGVGCLHRLASTDFCYLRGTDTILRALTWTADGPVRFCGTNLYPLTWLFSSLIFVCYGYHLQPFGSYHPRSDRLIPPRSCIKA